MSNSGVESSGADRAAAIGVRGRTPHDTVFDPRYAGGLAVQRLRPVMVNRNGSAREPALDQPVDR
jgi:hypothetical protein